MKLTEIHSTAADTVCENKGEYCEVWAEKGHCDNPYVTLNCALACKLCVPNEINAGADDAVDHDVNIINRAFSTVQYHYPTTTTPPDLTESETESESIESETESNDRRIVSTSETLTRRREDISSGFTDRITLVTSPQHKEDQIPTADGDSDSCKLKCKKGQRPNSECTACECSLLSTYTVKVTDPAGNPLENSVVRVSGRDTITGGDGVAEVTLFLFCENTITVENSPIFRYNIRVIHND
eukprot:sb/3469051/